ncbi:MAG: hypothetical protein LC731_06480 [Acidobacteria bacterium]|nr:hypothetical protein [Acidobacteriota bacterium]
MPLRPPDPRTIGINRQLADLESRVLTTEVGGQCNLDPERLARIEITLDAILRELAKLNASLALLAKSREPKDEPKKSKKSRQA